jgi:hypothetical protein
MIKTLMGLVIVPFLVCTALAGQPLTDKQMDKVIAGHDFSAVEFTNSTYVIVDIQQPVVLPPAGTVAVGAVSLPIASMVVQWGIIP